MSEEYLQSILNKCNDLSLSQDERLAYEGRLKQIYDQQAIVNEAKLREEQACNALVEKGIQAAKERGRKVAKIEVAKNMLTKGMDIELIVNVTELPIERVLKLNEELGHA